MGPFLLIGALLFFFWAAFHQSHVVLPPDTSKTERCPPHEWKYGEDGFLVCGFCHRKPGYDPRE